MNLNSVYEGSALGALLIVGGELFGVGDASLAGAGVFVAAVLVGFPMMAANLVRGTLHESTAGVLDIDFDAANAGNTVEPVSTE